jgi:hypothetical protein
MRITRVRIRPPVGLLKMWEKLPKAPAVTTPDDAARLLKTTTKRAEKLLERLSDGGWAVPVIEFSEGYENARYHVLPEDHWPEWGHGSFTGKQRGSPPRLRPCKSRKTRTVRVSRRSP